MPCDFHAGNLKIVSQEILIFKFRCQEENVFIQAWLFIGPYRRNLMISVIKCKKSQIFDNLLWLI